MITTSGCASVETWEAIVALRAMQGLLAIAIIELLVCYFRKPLTNSDVSIVHVTDCTEYESQSLPRRRIQENYVFVTHEMDTRNTDLLAHLYAEGVLEEEEKMEVDVLAIPSQRCERLLSIMGRKTAKQYEIFVNTLEATNQKHVADVLRLQGSFPFFRCKHDKLHGL